MRLELTGRQTDITDGVRRLIGTKLAKLERLLNDAAVSAQVVVSREKIGHRADITLHARGERFLHGNGQGENLGAAVAEAVEKLVQQARKVKGKYEGRKRQTVKTPEALDLEPTETRAKPARVSRTRVTPPRMVKAPRQTIRTLSAAEAAALAGGNGAPVIFLDAETLRIAVVYRAAGGDLTLVETRA